MLLLSIYFRHDGSYLSNRQSHYTLYQKYGHVADTVHSIQACCIQLQLLSAPIVKYKVGAYLSPT